MNSIEEGKPFLWIGGGGKRTRWYPHVALQVVCQETHRPLDVCVDTSWEALDPMDATEWLPEVERIADEWARFAIMVRTIAEGSPAAVCASCETRFYPSRSDARFCSSGCRMRSHRRRTQPER